MWGFGGIGGCVCVCVSPLKEKAQLWGLSSLFDMSQPGAVPQFPQLLPIACESGCKQESPRVLGCTLQP